MRKTENLVFLGIILFLFFSLKPEISSAGDWERKFYDIVKRLEKAAEIPFRIKILPSPIQEAYVYPDGAIVITEGLVNITHNDDEFAFIIAHEVSHLKQKKVAFKVPLTFLMESTYYPDFLIAEIKSDIFAAQLMAKAGYSPDAALTLFSRINSEDIPSYSERIHALSKYLNSGDKVSIPDIWKGSSEWKDYDGGFGEDFNE